MAYTSTQLFDNALIANSDGLKVTPSGDALHWEGFKLLVGDETLYLRYEDIAFHWNDLAGSGLSGRYLQPFLLE